MQLEKGQGNFENDQKGRQIVISYEYETSTIDGFEVKKHMKVPS